MKCPSCGFVQSDEVRQCKKCGFDLEAFRRGEKPAKPGWLKRLGQRKDAPLAVERHVSAEAGPVEASAPSPDFPPLPRPQKPTFGDRGQLSEKKRRRDTQDLADQIGIQSQLAALDEEKKKLRLQLEEFENRQRQHAGELQRQLDLEKQVAREEWEKAQRIQKQMETELAEVQRAKQQLLSELQEAQEAKQRVHSEMEEARRRQAALDTELETARELRRRTETQLQEKRDEHEAMLRRSSQLEAERLAELQQLMDERAAALEEQNRAIGEMESERLRITKAAQELQEERQRLETARREMEQQQTAMENREAEARPARERSAPPQPGWDENSAELRVKEDHIPAWQAEHRQVKGGPTARAEDLLNLLAEKERPSPPPAEDKPEPPPAPKPIEEVEEVWIEEGHENEEDEPAGTDETSLPSFAHHGGSARKHKRYVPPKGGLIFRLAAVAIDLSLVLTVVGVFALVGWLVAGVRLDPLRTIIRLGWAFNIIFVLLAAIYFTYLHGAYGQTLGKRLLGLRVLTTHGRELGYLNSFFRFAMSCFAVAGFGLGIIWIALDPNKQGWHDKLSRTVVLRGQTAIVPGHHQEAHRTA